MWVVQIAQIITCVTMIMCYALVAAPVAAMLHTTHENVPMGCAHECAHVFHSLEDAYDVSP